MYTLHAILLKLRNQNCNVNILLHCPGVFGSYAREEATEQSDINIGVEITAYLGLDFIEMADKIEALFGIKTDVVPMRSIKPEYMGYVKKDIKYV